MRPVLFALVLLAGCVQPAPEPEPEPQPQPPAASGPLELVSPAFEDGADMPEKHSCDGENVSPAFAITNAPPNATHAAMIMYDPDAPVPQLPQRNITHWLWWDAPLANGTVSFPEGDVPNGTIQGANEGGEAAYTGPCPPQVSPPHRYVFWAFALDAPLGLDEGADRAALEDALRGRVLAEATLTGMYARAITPEK